MVSSIYPPSTTPPPTRHHRRLLRPPRPRRRLLLRPPASFAPDHRQRLLLRPSPPPATPPPQMPRIRRHCRGIRFRSPRLAYSSSSCPLPTPPPPPPRRRFLFPRRSHPSPPHCWSFHHAADASPESVDDTASPRSPRLEAASIPHATQLHQSCISYGADGNLPIYPFSLILLGQFLSLVWK